MTVCTKDFRGRKFPHDNSLRILWKVFITTTRSGFFCGIKFLLLKDVCGIKFLLLKDVCGIKFLLLKDVCGRTVSPFDQNFLSEESSIITIHPRFLSRKLHHDNSPEILWRKVLLQQFTQNFFESEKFHRNNLPEICGGKFGYDSLLNILWRKVLLQQFTQDFCRRRLTQDFEKESFITTTHSGLLWRKVFFTMAVQSIFFVEESFQHSN